MCGIGVPLRHYGWVYIAFVDVLLSRLQDWERISSGLAAKLQL